MIRRRPWKSTAVATVVAIAATATFAVLAGAQGDGGSTARAPEGDSLPPSKSTIKSAKHIDLTRNFARLPLHRGKVGDETVWFVITDVSDRRVARKLGVNFAPRLANVTDGCPNCAQVVDSNDPILGRAPVTFRGAPDFSPKRQLTPGIRDFPPTTFRPGAEAFSAYSPFVMVEGSGVVFNAPIIATGDGDFDVTEHTNTHDRLLAIDPKGMTADLLLVEGFANGQPIVYLSFEASDPLTATLERNTFVPALALSPAADGGRRGTRARAAIFATINGKTGVRPSPPAQGENHLIADGRNTEDANLENEEVLEALRAGGDAHNVFDVFPTNDRRRDRNLYSPLWDLQLVEFAPRAVAAGENDAKTDANVIRQLATEGTVTAPGGTPLRSSGNIINCPALGFIKGEPRRPRAPRPPDQP